MASGLFAIGGGGSPASASDRFWRARAGAGLSGSAALSLPYTLLTKNKRAEPLCIGLTVPCSIILWQFPSLPKHVARAGCHSQLPNYN